MSLSPQFLDEVRARTSLSALIGRSVTLVKGGREHKGRCPFHDEKTPSFTVSDEKGFFHCFSCSAHGNAFDWLTRTQGLGFIDAVRGLADDAGLAMPERSPEGAARAARIAGLRPTLEAAAGIYAGNLTSTVRTRLRARGVPALLCERFGLGFAVMDGGLNGRGFIQRDLLASGLCGKSDAGFVYPRFKDRIMIPIHDARGRMAGFGARVFGAGEPAKATAKYINSAESEIFDKGRLLFNHHQARAHAHKARRVIVVEGYFDVIGLAACGIDEVVAPMGTALTEAQLTILWQLSDCPILMFDGDAAGQKAALRACAMALPLMGAGRRIKIATCPAGLDPDDLRLFGAFRGEVTTAEAVRRAEGDWGWLFGRAAVEDVLGAAVELSAFVFEAVAEGAVLEGDDSPEAIAGIWTQLDGLARSIGDDALRAQMLGVWRAWFERRFPPDGDVPAPLRSLTVSDDGAYYFPQSENDSETRLLSIVRYILQKRQERCALNDDIADALGMAKAIGFVPKAINAVILDIEADVAAREENEATWALYRRVLGVCGPMQEAIMPSIIDARSPRAMPAAAKRLAAARVLVEGQVYR